MYAAYYFQNFIGFYYNPTQSTKKKKKSQMATIVKPDSGQFKFYKQADELN